MLKVDKLHDNKAETLPHKKYNKILKYYCKKLTKIKYSRRANTYNHYASTSILSSMASRECLKR